MQRVSLPKKTNFEQQCVIMKKLLTLTFTISLTLAIAQINSTIKPLSFNLPDIPQNIAQFELPAFNLPEAELADEQDEKNGELPKFSRSIFTDITLTNAGNWIELSNGDRLWRVKIKSDGAQALLLYYNKFFLPTGATLHVYTEDKTEIRGAFTSFNNPRNGYFATGLTHGESCIIEYFEPVKVKGQGIISLNEIGHAYRWVNSIFPNVRGGSALGFNQSDACEVNINCEEGNDWQNEKRAVSCIIVQSQQGQGICSGTLINNVREDCTPYLLSAQHCSEFVSSNQYAQWIFHFNYESLDCNNPNSVGTLDDDFVVGCTKKADSDDNGGDTGSDFLLLELNQQPPTAFNVYYAGWDAAPTAPTGGDAVPHPRYRQHDQHHWRDDGRRQGLRDHRTPGRFRQCGFRRQLRSGHAIDHRHLFEGCKLYGRDQRRPAPFGRYPAFVRWYAFHRLRHILSRLVQSAVGKHRRGTPRQRGGDDQCRGLYRHHRTGLQLPRRNPFRSTNPAGRYLYRYADDRYSVLRAGCRGRVIEPQDWHHRSLSFAAGGRAEMSSFGREAFPSLPISIRSRQGVAASARSRP